MELLNYDKEKRVSTITLTDEELVDISSVFDGVESTFHMQDATILGVDKERLSELSEKLNKIIKAHLQIKGLKVPRWEDM